MLLLYAYWRFDLWPSIISILINTSSNVCNNSCRREHLKEWTSWSWRWGEDTIYDTLSFFNIVYDESRYNIHKFINVVYEKTTYNDTIFISENLRINIKTYLLHKIFLISSKHQSKQTINTTTICNYRCRRERRKEWGSWSWMWQEGSHRCIRWQTLVSNHLFQT